MWWDVSGFSIIIHSSLQDGTSSLMLACKNGHEKFVKILLDNKADVDHQDNVSGTSPAQ